MSGLRSLRIGQPSPDLDDIANHALAKGTDDGGMFGERDLFRRGR
jgi:hypothetical protein